VREGGFKVREGAFRVLEGRFKVRECAFRVRESRLKVREGGFKVREGGFKVREGGFKVREGALKVREGGLTVRACGLKVPEGGFKVREGGLEVCEGGFKVREGWTTTAPARAPRARGRSRPVDRVRRCVLTSSRDPVAFALTAPLPGSKESFPWRNLAVLRERSCCWLAASLGTPIKPTSVSLIPACGQAVAPVEPPSHPRIERWRTTMSSAARGREVVR
jgi:hypothetical protein